jgi:hypothetical protein
MNEMYFSNGLFIWGLDSGKLWSVNNCIIIVRFALSGVSVLEQSW